MVLWANSRACMEKENEPNTKNDNIIATLKNTKRLTFIVFINIIII
jgi:hypothetical protein